MDFAHRLQLTRAIRMGLLCVLLIPIACQQPLPGPIAPASTAPGGPALAAPAATPGSISWLSVDAEPTGATVSVDGAVGGSSPITLTVPPGVHRVEVGAAGYLSVSDVITFSAGEQAIYSPQLEDVVAPSVTMTSSVAIIPWTEEAEVRAVAADPAGVALIQLKAGDYLLGEAEGPELVVNVEPETIPGMAPGQPISLTATATDPAGNVGQVGLTLATAAEGMPTAVASAGQATPNPAGSPSTEATEAVPPTPAAQPTAAVEPSPEPTADPAEVPTIEVTKISLPTYPYAPFVHETVDPGAGDYPLLVLDREAYNNSHPQPKPKSYTLVVMENRYLKLSILPDLGGRLYECVFKPTGNNELYNNEVIKPTQWGPGTPDHPAGANWWIAAGGIEWGFPVDEHGYEWGTKWGYDPIHLPDGTAMVTVFTRDHNRPFVVVDILLAPSAAYFTIRPRITNPLRDPFSFKFWADAMVAPGAANAPSADLRFVYPVNQMTVHSTGDESLPKPGEPFSWPIFGGRDMSRLGNWKEWLGFFESPAAQNAFASVYDTAVDEGMVRVFADGPRGSKGFAMGWQDPIDWHEWTDAAGSGYVEIQGGLMPTYDDSYTLQSGDFVTWSETWYPAAGIGGMVQAGERGALNLQRTGTGVRAAVLATRTLRGKLTLAAGAGQQVVRQIAVEPGKPYVEEFALGTGKVKAIVTDESGQAVLAWEGEVK